ncbi:MAG: ABC transporter permease subunit [Chloroflexi bacterium]|nr:ABC transporter permease subunit [Chloroflexota bacterium]
MAETTARRRKKKVNWAPYLLILPSLVYLALFFAWPMIRGITLAVREEGALLTLRSEAQQLSLPAGQLPRGAQVTILDRQANVITGDEPAQADQITEIWFQIRAAGSDGQTVEGWTPESRIRVQEQDESGRPTAGTVRTILSSAADPLTSVYAEASEGSEIVGRLEARTEVEILGQEVLETWFYIRGQEGESPPEGWVQARYIRTTGNGTQGRIDRGNAGQFTTRYIQRMVNDRFFWPALRTTLLLIVLIIPVQFILAMIMALVIQANPKGSGFFLYVFSIALGISDLAVGIVFYSIFTQLGFLNSILQSLGLIDAPITYLSARTRYWIIIAIWIAEVWRATAIIMVIVVAGLQAISHEVLEAAEVFGATLWQRIRFIILPLLKPSLQVALILRTILAFQVFSVVIVLGGGDIVTVLANETYRQYYELRNFNVAAAYASFIMLLSLASAVVYLRAVRSQEEVSG